MRSRRGIAAAAFGFALLAPRAARAQDARARAVIAASIGFTDNVTSAGEQDGLGAEADGFATVSPGFVLGYATPRTAQTLRYTFTGDIYFRHTEGSSYTNTAAWTARFITSPTTTLTLGATGGQGVQNTLVRSQEPGMTAVDALPTEGARFVQGGFSEGITKQLSPVVSAAQSGSFLVYTPLADDPARTYNATNTLTAQRLFRHDTAALALSFAYTHFDNVPVGGALASRAQLVNTLVASWTHAFGRHFQSQIDVGATQATDLSGEFAQLWQPAGLLAARYLRDEGQAELSYAHAAELNVFLSQIALVDQVTLRLAAPIRRAPRLSVEGSAGVQLGRPIEAGQLGELTTVLLADAAVRFTPVTAVPDLDLSLRYQHVTQLGTEGAGDAATDTRLVHNTLLFSISGAFPRSTETAARISITQPFGSAGPEGGRRTPEPQGSEEGEEPLSRTRGDSAFE